MSIQLDYGGFDPTFVGITAKLSSESALDAYIREVDRLGHRRYDDLSTSEIFELFAATTVTLHETRHFHDFLISPYSARIFKHRVQHALNAYQLLPELIKGIGNCVPVPVPVWCGLNEGQRSEELLYWPPTKSGQLWQPVQLPYIPDITEDDPNMFGTGYEDASIGLLIQAAAQGQRKIDELAHNPENETKLGTLQPWQVFEMSGILVQLSDVRNAYGDPAMKFFIDYMYDSVPNNPYTFVLELAGFPWVCKRRSPDSAVLSAMAIWSICGSYRSDEWQACPSERLVKLVHAMLRKESLIERSSSIQAMWDSWSEETGLSTVGQGLDETDYVLEGLVRRLDELIQSDIGEYLEKRLALVRRIAEGVLQSSRHMTDCLRRDPDTYVWPETYLWCGSKYVNPVYRLYFDGLQVGLKSSIKELQERGYDVIWQSQEPDGNVMVMINPLSVSDHSFLETSDVVDFDSDVLLLDLLFAKKARARREVQFAGRTLFDETGLAPIELSQLI